MTINKDEAIKALDALEQRIDSIHNLCCTLAPKQAVGESIAVAQKMSEWGIVRAAITHITPDTATIPAPAVAPDSSCSHVWNDFGQLGGRNVAWCPRCDVLAWTGKEPETPAVAPDDLPPMPPSCLAAILHDAAESRSYGWDDLSRWMMQASDALHAITKWAENRDRRAAPTDASDLHFNAQRLRNVATLVGLADAVPEDDATLDGARGAVLGQIAAKLRAAVPTDAKPVAIMRDGPDGAWAELTELGESMPEGSLCYATAPTDAQLDLLLSMFEQGAITKETVKAKLAGAPTQSVAKDTDASVRDAENGGGLSFDQIEDAFPEEGLHTRREDGAVVVSAQWLHDFARAIYAMRPTAIRALRSPQAPKQEGGA